MSPKEFTEWANAVGLAVVISVVAIALIALLVMMLISAWRELNG